MRETAHDRNWRDYNDGIGNMGILGTYVFIMSIREVLGEIVGKVMGSRAPI